MGRIELPSIVYETIALPLSYIGSLWLLAYFSMTKLKSQPARTDPWQQKREAN
jgi:hypothetical protein